MPAWLTDPAFWQYASLPLVAALIGGLTQWLAALMTFRPAGSARLAEIFASPATLGLASLPELFGRLDPEKIAGQVLKVMTPRVRRMTDEVMLEQDPGLWRSTPELVRQRIYASIETRLPEAVRDLTREIGERIEELVDFEHLVAGRLAEDPGLANRIFLACGQAELRFLVRGGFYFGFLFGLLQLGLWLLFPAWWTLPLAGALVYSVTRSCALAMVFRPLRPARVGPFVLQGKFLARQKEAAAAWSQVVGSEILGVRAIFAEMLGGPKKEITEALVRQHIESIVFETVGFFQSGLEMALGREKMRAIRESVGSKSIAIAGHPFGDWQFSRERSEPVEELLRERLEAMPPEDFAGLLRPCFQHSGKPLLAGTLFGLLVGWFQAFFVFGG